MACEYQLIIFCTGKIQLDNRLASSNEDNAAKL